MSSLQLPRTFVHLRPMQSFAEDRSQSNSPSPTPPLQPKVPSFMMSFKPADSMLSIVQNNIQAAAMFAEGSPLISRRSSFLTKNEGNSVKFAVDSQQRVSHAGHQSLMEALQIQNSPALLPTVNVNVNFGHLAPLPTPQIDTRDVPKLFPHTPGFGNEMTVEKPNYT